MKSPSTHNLQIQNSQKKRWLPKGWFPAEGWFWISLIVVLLVSAWTLGRVIDHTGKGGLVGETKGGDYSHELASAFLGAIVTITCTAVLFKGQANAQAQVEQERESNTKVFEEKMRVYSELLKGLEKFLQKENGLKDCDFTKLTSLCLHASYIANRDVLNKLSDFTESLLAIIREDSQEVDQYEEQEEGRDPITHAERKTILGKFGEVATSVKTDLDRSRVFIKSSHNKEFSSNKEYYERARNEDEPSRREAIQVIIDNLAQCSVAYAQAERRLKSKNVNSPSSSSMNFDSFMHQCSKEERIFYGLLLSKLEKARDTGRSQYDILWTHKGFALEHTIKFLPSAGSVSVVINRPTHEESVAKIRQHLERVLDRPEKVDFTKPQNFKFDWLDIKHSTNDVENWMKVIQSVLEPTGRAYSVKTVEVEHLVEKPN